MTANEAAVDAQVEGCIWLAWVVVADCEDELDAVVDEGDCCQHDPGNQQASLALSYAMDKEGGANDIEDADDKERDHRRKCDNK